MPFSFPRSYRLLKADEFSSVFSFRRTAVGEFFQIQVKPNGMDHPRLGMVVARKTEKLAVGRNLAKRLVREYFRTNRGKFDGLDVVVRLRKPLSRACPAEIRMELHELTGRVTRVAAPYRTD